MPPPTKNAHRQSCQTGEGGEAEECEPAHPAIAVRIPGQVAWVEDVRIGSRIGLAALLFRIRLPPSVEGLKILCGIDEIFTWLRFSGRPRRDDPALNLGGIEQGQEPGLVFWCEAFDERARPQFVECLG